MGRAVCINYMDYYVPEKGIAITDVFGGLNSDQRNRFENETKFLTFSEKYFQTDLISVEEQRSLPEMLSMMLDNLFDNYPVKRELVRHLFLCGEYENNLNNLGHQLLDKYKFPNSNTATIRGNYCANIEVAMEFACNYLERTQDEAYVVILVGNKLTDIASRLVGSYGILGDSSGVILLSNKKVEKTYTIKDVSISSDGSLYLMDMFEDNMRTHYKGYKTSIANILPRNNIKLKEIQHIITHNANTILLDFVLKSMDKTIDYKQKKFANKQFSHQDTVDIIINLKALEETINPSDKVLTLGLGAAGTYATVLMEYA